MPFSKIKKITTILAVIIVSVFLISVAKDQIIRSAVKVGASVVTGAPVQIDGFSLGILKQSVSIKGFRLYNPPGFPEGILLDIPKISVACDIGALLKKKLHIKEAEINIKRLEIIRNKDGQLNVEELKVAKQKEEKPEETKKEKAPQMAMQIDILKLNVGQIVFRDYSKGEPPSVQVYETPITDKTYKNITSPEQLVTLILSESLKKTAIQSAKIYAASTILSAGFLPAGVAVTLLGKDSAKQAFDMPFEKIYQTTLDTVKKAGTVKTENKAKGIITGYSADKTAITVNIKKVTEKTTEVTVSGRKLLLPKPEIAKGVLLQISENLE